MQSIQTKFIPPASVKGSRVKATASGGKSLTIEWDDALGPDENHKAAVSAFITKHGWDNYAWFMGGVKGGGNVYVCAAPFEGLAFNVEQAKWVAASPRSKR